MTDKTITNLFAFLCHQRQCLGLLTRFSGSDRLRQFKLQDDHAEGDRVNKRDEMELAMQQVRSCFVMQPRVLFPEWQNSLFLCVTILRVVTEMASSTGCLWSLLIHTVSSPADLCQCDAVLPVTYDKERPCVWAHHLPVHSQPFWVHQSRWTSTRWVHRFTGVRYILEAGLKLLTNKLTNPQKFFRTLRWHCIMVQKKLL